MRSWVSNTDVFCRLRKSSVCIKLLQMPNWGGSSLLQGFELLYMGRKLSWNHHQLEKKALLLFYSYGTERDERSVLSSLESAGSSFYRDCTGKDISQENTWEASTLLHPLKYCSQYLQTSAFCGKHHFYWHIRTIKIRQRSFHLRYCFLRALW